MDDRDPQAARRQRRQHAERRGRLAEGLAAAYLIATGHRILARRVRTHAGEIDIIALRLRRLSFIEVKQRATTAELAFAVTPRQAKRLHAAAEAWLQRYPRYRDCDLGFDRCDIVGRWRIHWQRDALQPLA